MKHDKYSCNVPTFSRVKRYATFIFVTIALASCVKKATKESNEIWRFPAEIAMPGEESTSEPYEIVADSIREMKVPYATLIAASYASYAKQKERYPLFSALSVEEVLDLFEVHPFDDQLLLTICVYPLDPLAFPELHLSVFDTSFQYVGEGTLQGAQNDIGSVRVADMDNDNRSEVIYTVNNAKMDGDRGSIVTSFHEFDASHGFNEVFMLIDAEWDCIHKNPYPYDSIHREWLFVSAETIKITEEKWQRDCFEVLQGDRYVEPELISREHSYFYWNERLRQYVPR